ncbi:hypothetical protein E6O75_ATG00637 [Venturia nashicola]|uniref:Uncharacterized protein n=1 Tax=Venturia nashicola TaxID=86259 RepID=A0A4Z1PWQ9_9PEZI|nr:hypothetical protein E6O75_ATG00637 [Venturia nashicola]
MHSGGIGVQNFDQYSFILCDIPPTFYFLGSGTPLGAFIPSQSKSCAILGKSSIMQVVPFTVLRQFWIETGTIKRTSHLIPSTYRPTSHSRAPKHILPSVRVARRTRCDTCIAVVFPGFILAQTAECNSINPTAALIAWSQSQTSPHI